MFKQVKEDGTKYGIKYSTNVEPQSNTQDIV